MRATININLKSHNISKRNLEGRLLARGGGGKLPDARQPGLGG